MNCRRVSSRSAACRGSERESWNRALLWAIKGSFAVLLRHLCGSFAHLEPGLQLPEHACTDVALGHQHRT